MIFSQRSSLYDEKQCTGSKSYATLGKPRCAVQHTEEGGMAARFVIVPEHVRILCPSPLLS